MPKHRLSRLDYEKVIHACQGKDLVGEIAEKLEPIWCDEYYDCNPQADLVSVNLSDCGTAFTYVFDLKLARVVVSYGIPVFATHKRDASRMAGHPLEGGKGLHRGHLMAHSLGGGTDVNLVPRLGKLNVGEFRRLERLVRDKALQNQRCLYFVRCLYFNDSQRPSKFEQCVISPPRVLEYVLHSNL